MEESDDAFDLDGMVGHGVGRDGRGYTVLHGDGGMHMEPHKTAVEQSTSALEVL